MSCAGSPAAFTSGARLAFFLAMAALGLALLLAGPVSGGGPPEYIGSDYTVGAGESQILENRTLVISGNVTVATGGSLELRNSSLLLDLSSNGSLALTVQT